MELLYTLAILILTMLFVFAWAAVFYFLGEALNAIANKYNQWVNK